MLYLIFLIFYSPLIVLNTLIIICIILKQLEFKFENLKTFLSNQKLLKILYVLLQLVFGSQAYLEGVGAKARAGKNSVES